MLYINALENNRAYAMAKEAREALKALEAVDDQTKSHEEALNKPRPFTTSMNRSDGAHSRLQTLKNSIKDSEEAIEFGPAWLTVVGAICSKMRIGLHQGGSSYAKSRQQPPIEEGKQ